MRILFLTHPGANSRDIFFDIIEGYHDAGHDIFILELAPLCNARSAHDGIDTMNACATLFADTISSFAASNRIDLCVCLWANASMSLSGTCQESFFQRSRLPILMHWLDAPQWAHGSTVLDAPHGFFNGSHNYHLVNNPGTANELTAILKFSNVLWSHNAASPTSFRPHPDVEKDFDIVFGVGADHVEPTPLMLDELVKHDPNVTAIRADVASRLAPELCDIIRPILCSESPVETFINHILAKRLENRDVEVLYQLSETAQENKGFAPSVLALLENHKTFVRFSLALRRLEEWDRAFTFVFLSRHFRCATFGFNKSFTAWPGEWEHLGELPYQEQCRAYSRGRFGLNVMRWQDDLGLNLKPFEITLSGACLLQSYRVGIEACFDDTQSISFRTPGECRDRVADALKDTTAIDRMAEAGRQRALAEHCWKHRAKEIVTSLTEYEHNTRSEEALTPGETEQPKVIPTGG